MAQVTGYIQVKGDAGNPNGSGLSKMSLPRMDDEAHADIEARLKTYHAALKTAQFTATNIGEVGVTYGDGSSALKPGASVNTDRKMVTTWNRTSDSAIRRHTIPGVPASGTGFELQDAGERINDTGRTALAAAMNAAYGYDDIVILTGKILQPS
jgi:hypothetical protein